MKIFYLNKFSIYNYKYMGIFKEITRKKVLICASIIVAFAVCIYFSLGYLAGIFITSERMEEYFYNQTGLNLSLKSPKLKTMPDFSLLIGADNIDIYSKNKNISFLSVSKPNLRIKIFPLIFKNINITSLKSKSLNINIARDENGRFDFEEYLNENMEFPLKLKFKKTNINIDSAVFLFADKKNSRNTKVVTKKFQIGDFSESKSLYFNLEGGIDIDDLIKNKNTKALIDAKGRLKLPLLKHLDSKDTYVDIKLSGLDIEPVLPYINEFSNIKFQVLSGRGDFSLKSVKNGAVNDFDLTVAANNLEGKFLYNDKLNEFSLKESAWLYACILAGKEKLKINYSAVKSVGMHVLISGEIDKYKTKNPDLNLNIKVDNSDFIRLVNLVPAGLVVYKTDIINELKKAKPSAVVKADIKVKGDTKQPDIRGNLDFNDIYLFDKPRNFPLATAKCEFIGDKVNVDVIVPGPNSQFVKVKGVSELYGKQSGDYDISSSDAVNLAFAQKYLIPVQRVIGFKLGPLPVMKVDGVGNIHIVTSGTIYDATVDGKFFGKNVTASMEGLNAQLKNGKIELDFNGKTVSIVDTSAKMLDGVFSLSGNADDYGNMDIKADVKNIGANDGLNIAKTSDIFKAQIGNIDFIKSANGTVDFTLYLKGKSDSLEGLDFLKDILPTGEITLSGVSTVVLPNISLNNINGKITYGKDYKINLATDYKNAKISVAADMLPDSPNLSKNGNKIKFNANCETKNLYFSDVLSLLESQNYFNNQNLKLAASNALVRGINFSSNSKITAKGVVPADYTKIDLSKIILDGTFAPVNSSISKNIKFNSGTYEIKKSKLFIKDSNINVYGANILSWGSVDNLLTNPQAVLKVRADAVALSGLGSLLNYSKIPALNAVLKDFTDYKGTMSANLDIKKSALRGNVSFDGAGAHNKKQNLNLRLNSGGLRFNGDKVFVDALNFTYGTTPLYFNAVVADYNSEKPKFNALFTTNLDEASIDKLINPYLTYPFKVKGEIRLKGRITGGLNNYTVFSYLTLPIDTDITYMGANIGDTQYNREFASRVDFTKNTAKINSAQYIKYIPSQNNKPTPVVMLKIDGNVISSGKKLTFNNLRINTQNPVTAKFFNVIFKKSILKQGLFTCALRLNGEVTKPLATGNINFQNINIPLYSTKVNDMDFEISKNVINGVMKGKSFDSDIEIKTRIQNNPSFPIVLNTLDIKSKKTSLSQVFDGFAQIPKVSSDIVPGQPIVFKPHDLIIVKGTAVADEVELYNIKASNLKTEFSNPTGLVFNVDNMVFDIAGGSIQTKGSFDINSSEFKLNSEVKDCDANLLSESFLSLNNQIYGRADANISLSGKIPENAQDLKSVQGNVNFSVNNGKMPKLGSLEYLLRAGNLIKGGVLGLSLNSLIEVLTPYKTGEFSAIKGSFKIKDANINSLEIFSRGKNLSLFIYGDYDIMNDNADIEILGRLSKNVSNLLGPLGNASLNSLLSAVTGNKIKDGARAQIIDNVNKIPLIELSGDDFRLFIAKIKGSLNSDDYVKSFNWLN